MRRLLNFLIAVITIYCVFLLITIEFKKVQIGSFAEFDVVGNNQFFLILAFNIVFFMVFLYAVRYVRAWLNVHRKPMTALFALQVVALLMLATEAYALGTLKTRANDEFGNVIRV